VQNSSGSQGEHMVSFAGCHLASEIEKYRGRILNDHLQLPATVAGPERGNGNVNSSYTELIALNGSFPPGMNRHIAESTTSHTVRPATGTHVRQSGRNSAL